MIHPNFVIFAVLLQFFGGLDYIVQTVKGKVKPNRISWFLWAVAPLIAFVAELQKGVGIQSLMTFMVGFVPLLVFIASFVNKKSEWKLGLLDKICGGLSLFGLVLWFVTKEANVAIAFSIFSDWLAGMPTLVKSYNYPETESHWVYSMGAIATLITLLTINQWNFETFGFPLYIFFFNTTAFLLIKFKVGQMMRRSI